MNLEERIRFAIQQSGMSARAVALKAGLSHGYFTYLFRALEKDPTSSISIETAQRIADATGVSRTWLLSGTGQPDDTSADAAMIPSRARFDELPEWAELVERAKVLDSDLPAWVWEQMGRTAPILTAAPTPLMIAELGRWMLRHEQLVRPHDARKESAAHPARTPSGSR